MRLKFALPLLASAQANQRNVSVWTEWSSFGDCSVTCGLGLKTRTRSCPDKSCFGADRENMDCDSGLCPMWGEWSSFSSCSVSCGNGFEQRTRSCLNGDGCPGPNEEQSACDAGSCPTWSEWGPFAESCSVTCGGGLKERTRTCSNSDSDLDCDGTNKELTSCNEQDCPSWTEWSSFGECSVTCGLGQKTRTRSCPGNSCDGPNRETMTCDAGLCENDDTDDSSENETETENTNEDSNNVDAPESKIGKVAGCNGSDGSIQLEAHINKDDVHTAPDGFVLDGDLYKATFDAGSLTPSRDGDDLLLTKTVEATGKQVDVEGTVVKTHISETINFVCRYRKDFSNKLLPLIE